MSRSNNSSQEKKWTEWFEIPVENFERAKEFYEKVFAIDIETIDYGPVKMGIFPHKDVGCAICKGDAYKVGNNGPIVMINANPDLQNALDRIEENGGKILQAKTQISPEHGYGAQFLDSEGNNLGLHSYS